MSSGGDEPHRYVVVDPPHRSRFEVFLVELRHPLVVCPEVQEDAFATGLHVDFVPPDGAGAVEHSQGRGQAVPRVLIRDLSINVF